MSVLKNKARLLCRLVKAKQEPKQIETSCLSDITDIRFTAIETLIMARGNNYEQRFEELMNSFILKLEELERILMK